MPSPPWLFRAALVLVPLQLAAADVAAPRRTERRFLVREKVTALRRQTSLHRPRFESRFGRGFCDDGRDVGPSIGAPSGKHDGDHSVASSIEAQGQQSQEPSPYSFGETIGIIVGVPILLLVRLVQLRWILPYFRVLDALIARPIGVVIDAVLFCVSVIGWSLSMGLVLPVAQCAAMAWDVVILPLLTYALYLPTKALWIHVVLRCWELLHRFLLRPLLCGCLRLVELSIAALLFLRQNFVAYLMIPIWCHLLQPLLQGLERGYQIAAAATETYLIMPLIRFLLRPIWKGLCVIHQRALLPLWKVANKVWQIIVVEPLATITRNWSVFKQRLADWWPHSSIVICWTRIQAAILAVHALIQRTMKSVQSVVKNWIEKREQQDEK